MNIEIQSKQMKSKALKVIAAISLFVLVYILFISFAIGFAFGSVWLFYKVITRAPNPFTIGLVGFLIVFGFMIAYFLIRSLIYRQKNDTTGLIEITERDEPKLFKIISEITEILQVEFPDHIYISPAVSASVQFDMSLKSLLLKPPANLHLGAGLINCLHEEEFKAVVGHEFGHFSQKYIRTGGYLYYVNHVIYAIANDESFYNRIAKMAGGIPIIANIAGIAVHIMRGIQWTFVKLHNLINKSYMALSRELEFHADACAALCATPSALANALMRIELGEGCFNDLIAFYEQRYNDKIITKNIYPQLSWLLIERGNQFELHFENDLPKVELDTIKYFDQSQITIQDQWASHPSTEERVQRLYGMSQQHDYARCHAWNLFRDPVLMQEQTTRELFNQLKAEPSSITYLSDDSFKNEVLTEQNKNTFDPLYKYVYNEREIETLELVPQAYSSERFEHIFSRELCNTYYAYLGMKKDDFLLNQFIKNNISARTFDYRGVKHRRKEAGFVLAAITEQKNQAEALLRQADLRAYRYFLSIETKVQKQAALNIHYQDYFAMTKKCSDDREYLNSFLEHVEFMNQPLEFESIRWHCSALKGKEVEFKRRLWDHYFGANGLVHIPSETQEKVSDYLKSQQVYFFQNKYSDTAVEKLNLAIQTFDFLIARNLYEVKKKLLDYQIELEKSNAT